MVSDEDRGILYGRVFVAGLIYQLHDFERFEAQGIVERFKNYVDQQTREGKDAYTTTKLVLSLAGHACNERCGTRPVDAGVP